MSQDRSIVKHRIIRLAGVFVAIGMINFATAQPSGEVARPDVEQLTAAQLDQLTAPVALYPDPLLGSVLAAATYPLEVVEAARWLDDRANAALKGDALATALESRPWDPSVKLLVSFPQVLKMMNSNLEWTEELGDAFLAQQADVMDSVQRLRQRAAANGSLRSTPQQTVSTEEGEISIAPANADVLYVPYYVPMDVYGPWPWPDYPPYYFVLSPGAFFYGGALIGFGIGIPIFAPYWGWYGWDWPGHGLRVTLPRPRHGPPGRASEQPTGTWRHEVAHRGGVPYRDSATAQRYLSPEAASRRPYRGFPPMLAPHAGAQAPPAAPAEAPAMHERITPPPPARAPAPRPAPPAFESFGRGAEVRGEANRGSYSRSAPAPSSHGGGVNPGHH